MPVYIGPTHPLSRFYVFPPIPFADIEFTSIEAVFCYVMLLQHDLLNEAEWLLHCPSVLSKPHVIYGWTRTRLEEAGISPTASWLFNSSRTYLRIMCELMKHKNNPFDFEILRLYFDHGEDLFFCVPSGNCFVWGCGLRLSQAERAGSRYPGLNLWGKVLTKLMVEWHRSDFSYRYNLTNFFLHPVFAPTPYYKTVLLISDSQFRQVKGISEGKIESISGARYNRLASFITNNQINLLDYRYVIINCGVNDARHPRRSWNKSWQPLCQLLKQIRGEHTTVLLNTALDIPRAKNVKQHYYWIRKEFDIAFAGCRQYKFVNWSGHKSSIFLLPNGQINNQYFFGDKFHINHRRFGLLWEKWCEKLPEIRSLAIQFSADLYPNAAD